MNLLSAPAWAALKANARRLSAADAASLVADDARSHRLLLQQEGAQLDARRQLLSFGGIEAAITLARELGVVQARRGLITGEHLNTTEHRPALHCALRAQPSDGFPVDVMVEVHTTRQRMASIANQIRGGQWLGATGQPIQHIINIGIGGSDLGPRLAVDALAESDGPTIDFVANIDGHVLDRILRRADPAATLFLITSKSFGTQETLTNARSAQRWLCDQLGVPAAALARHFIAITARPARVEAAGFAAVECLPMHDYVGGRFSLWSAAGLSIAIALGIEAFDALLAGARAMDQHFFAAPVASNWPLWLGLIGVFNRNALDIPTHAVVAYDDRLRLLPQYLQQLEMESNGKRVDIYGEVLDYPTVPVIWGGVGSDAQHAFFQWLHQSADDASLDLIGFEQADHELDDHHRKLLANLHGQSQALLCGRLADTDLGEHRTCPGARPHSVLMFDRLTPFNLGRLLALYEHKVFVQGRLWGVNSFDQWGVEIGKQLADELLAKGQ